jgi:hypothetical protein
MDVLTAIVGGVGLQALFLMSTYACTHQWKAFCIAGVVVLVTGMVLYFTWYRHLPADDEMSEVTSIETS